MTTENEWRAAEPSTLTVDEARERADAATPGPWRHESPADGEYVLCDGEIARVTAQLAAVRAAARAYRAKERIDQILDGGGPVLRAALATLDGAPPPDRGTAINHAASLGAAAVLAREQAERIPGVSMRAQVAREEAHERAARLKSEADAAWAEVRRAAEAPRD